MFEAACRQIVVEVGQSRTQFAADNVDDHRLDPLETGIRNFGDRNVVIEIDHQTAQLVTFGIDDANGIRFFGQQRPPAFDGRGDPLPDQLCSQLLATEGEDPKADFGPRRVKTRRDARAAGVVEVGDRGVGRAGLGCDGARKNPGMAIGDDPILAALEGQSPSVAR